MTAMHVCVLIPVLDAFKGGNHLPLLGACTDIQFTIVTNATKPKSPELPSNVEVITLGQRLGPYYYGCADYRFASAVCKKYPPTSDFWKSFDVIHLNQTLHPRLLSLEKSGTPVLYAVHHPVSVDCAIAMQESSPLWLLKYALLKRWQKNICRSASHIMTVSETVKKRLHQDYGCDTSKVHIVPNGVDGKEFTMVEDAEFDVCAVGSLLHPRKGFRYLVDAYKKLSTVRIADVGRRSAEQQQELAKLPHVTVLGMLDHEDLVHTIQRSKVLISTSLYEGFGISLIEALACGRPVVAFDSGAVREVLSPIDPEMIVPQRDIDALTKRVQEYVSISEERRRKLREEVLRRYSLAQSAEALVRLYAELVSR